MVASSASGDVRAAACVRGRRRSRAGRRRSTARRRWPRRWRTTSRSREQITLLDQQGSSVFYGDLQLVPIGDGILYVRPLYVRSDTINQLSYRYVLVSYEGEAAFGATLQQALAKLFPGLPRRTSATWSESAPGPGSTGRSDGARRAGPDPHATCSSRPTTSSTRPRRRCARTRRTSPPTPRRTRRPASSSSRRSTSSAHRRRLNAPDPIDADRGPGADPVTHRLAVTLGPATHVPRVRSTTERT